jgi:hypothetical protein
VGPWADALFELADAVLCAGGPACSLPRLSLEPVFGRGHGSVYAALARGAVNVEALEDLLAAARPRSWPLVFAVDGTSWPGVPAPQQLCQQQGERGDSARVQNHRSGSADGDASAEAAEPNGGSMRASPLSNPGSRSVE